MHWRAEQHPWLLATRCQSADVVKSALRTESPWLRTEPGTSLKNQLSWRTCSQRRLSRTLRSQGSPHHVASPEGPPHGGLWTWYLLPSGTTSSPLPARKAGRQPQAGVPGLVSSWAGDHEPQVTGVLQGLALAVGCGQLVADGQRGHFRGWLPGDAGDGALESLHPGYSLGNESAAGPCGCFWPSCVPAPNTKAEVAGRWTDMPQPHPVLVQHTVQNIWKGRWLWQGCPRPELSYAF